MLTGTIKYEGKKYWLEDEVSWDDGVELWTLIALGDDGIYRLYYEEPEGEEYELDDIDYDNPIDAKNITREFDIDYLKGYKVIGSLERVEHGLIDFVADALREYEGEYIQPVQIGYMWEFDDLIAEYVFVDGENFENSKGEIICVEPDTIKL